jgi:hypothetical protein
MEILNWQETPLETHVKWLLIEKYSVNGQSLWTKYESLRNEVISKVLPWIATQEPDLTDHGVSHIQDVMGNAALLLGFKNEFGVDCKREADHGFTPYEMIVLLSGLLTHDIGNILGRSRHNQNIITVWKDLNSWKDWSDNDRQLIISIGRAHTGKSPEGAGDTLEPLAVGRYYFYKQPIKAAAIAAVIRFADELAEGPQRTSAFLLKKRLIRKKSIIYHDYAVITTPAGIDRIGGRIALTYHLHVDNSNYPPVQKDREIHVAKLLRMIYSRAAKLNFERRFARHYAQVLAPFKETSVSLNLLRQEQSINCNLLPIMLNDFGPESESHDLIQSIDNNYQIKSLIQLVFGENDE